MNDFNHVESAQYKKLDLDIMKQHNTNFLNTYTIIFPNGKLSIVDFKKNKINFNIFIKKYIEFLFNKQLNKFKMNKTEFNFDESYTINYFIYGNNFSFTVISDGLFDIKNLLSLLKDIQYNIKKQVKKIKEHNKEYEIIFTNNSFKVLENRELIKIEVEKSLEKYLKIIKVENDKKMKYIIDDFQKKQNEIIKSVNEIDLNKITKETVII